MGPRITMALAALVVAAVGLQTPVAAQSGDGRGTARSSVRATDLAIDALEDVRVQVLDLTSTATLDKGRGSAKNVPVNFASGILKAAVIDLGQAGSEFFPRQLGTLEVSRDENSKGSDRRGQNLAVSFAVPGDAGAAEIGADNPAVASLLTDIDGVRRSTVADGLVAKGAVRPLDLEALFTAAGPSFAGGSTVDSIEALGGLVAIQKATISDQETVAARDLTRGSLREFAVESVRVVGVNELLGLLGLDRGEIPLATLAATADALGLEVSGLIGAVPATGLGTTWTAVNGALASSKVSLEQQLGGVCSALPSELTGLLGQAGVSCSGTVQQALDAVNALLGQLLALVEGTVFDAALLTAEGLGASVQAVAAVTEDGRAETSAAVNGVVETLRVGSVDVGGLAADLTTTPLATLQRQWNALGDSVNKRLDAVLGTLGPAYQGLVTVTPAPVAIQSTKIDGDYAVADAALTLLRVRVTLPSSLPDPQDLAAVAPPVPITTPTTTVTVPPVTVPPVTVPTLPLVPTTVTLPTLPIAHVRDAVVRPQVAPLGSAVIDVGVFSAHADHTRPGVKITGGGENRTWNGRTGFGNPGSLPRTGGNGAWPLAIFVTLAVTAVGLNHLARTSARRLER